MSQAIKRLVAQALHAIDQDEPSYVEPLNALRTLPGALAVLEAEPELASALFVELRKLRPFPLWVRDTPARALALKQLGRLDGAICIGSDEPWPAAEGRECWREVSAAEAQHALASLPTGWGLIVRGEVARIPWSELRRSAPLRALGLARDGEPGARSLQTASDIRLDIVTLDPGRASEAGLGARVLWALPTAGPRELAHQALPLAALAPSSGLLCTGDDALSCALWFACVRAAPRH
jgi:hypothetical protein